MKRILLLLALMCCGVSTSGVVNNVPYVIAFRPLNSTTQPYVGQMYLNFNNGIVSGRYTDISIRPGSPFANQINVPVSGGVSNGNVQLIIRQHTFRGTLKGEWISGDVTLRGRIYVFEAEQGKAPGT
jgi:hypothetical protein